MHVPYSGFCVGFREPQEKFLFDLLCVSFIINQRRRHTSMHTATIDPVVQMGIRLGGEGTGGVKTISGD